MWSQSDQAPRELPVRVVPHGIAANIDGAPEVACVGNLMSRDVFALRVDDPAELAACLMEIEPNRNVPVEDEEGRLVGVVSWHEVICLVGRGRTVEETQRMTVGDLLEADPISVHPDTPTTEAIYLMQRERIDCMPVVVGGKMIGVITQSTLLTVLDDLLVHGHASL
jgi:CBS domain-containing protein